MPASPGVIRRAQILQQQQQQLQQQSHGLQGRAYHTSNHAVVDQHAK